MMIVGFTGHRDKLADEKDLLEVHNLYPDALWISGGAEGFDQQVIAFGKSHDHELIVISPNYKKYYLAVKLAPLKRNEMIVDKSDIIVALYDGRTKGGTYYTIKYARKINKPIIFLKEANSENY